MAGIMTPNEINDLLRSPSESLSVEIKSWLDLDNPMDQGKVARTLLALRNHNGGTLIFGFDDKTLQPAVEGRPTDVRAAFHADKIQRIVKEFCLPPFEANLVHGVLGDDAFPVVTVPAGVRFPAIARKTLPSLVEGKPPVIRQHAVYVRSVNNGIIESVEPRSAADRETLLQTCFDNREAEIGRFLQRHAPALVREIRSPSDQPPAIVTSTAPTASKPSPPQPSSTPTQNAAVEILRDGQQRFEKRVQFLHDQRQAQLSERKGWREVAVVCDGPVHPVPASRILEELFTRHPRFTGWPAWIDSRGFTKEAQQPYPNQGGWEALVTHKHADETEAMIDFWRIEPQGHFYLRRTYEDDVMAKLGDRRGKVLDFVLVVGRAAEALATAHAFARALAKDPEAGTMIAAFRWTNLQGRELDSWVERSRDIWTAVPAYESEATAQITVPLATPLVALSPYVEQAVKPLFAAFGVELSPAVVQEIGDKIIQRTR